MDYTVLSQYAPLIFVLAIWELIWKGLGLWRAGRLNQPYWFIAILIFNTVGILPIIYLVMTRSKNTQ